MARLKDYYKQEVAPALMKKFCYKSVMQIPKLDKIVINVGAGEAKDNAKVIDTIMRRSCRHHRPEAHGLQSEKICCQLQTACRDEHWREGNAARRPDV